MADKDGVVQTKVDASVIQEAFEAAPLTGTGLRQVELRQKPVSGASTYEVSLPASALADQGESRVFQIVTELGTLELPATLSTEDLAGRELAKVRIIRMELPKQSPINSERSMEYALNSLWMEMLGQIHMG